MAQIIYRNEDGKDVVIKNPSDADIQKMWECIAKRIAPEVQDALVKDTEFLKEFMRYVPA